MLTIKNIEKLKSQKILTNTTKDGYYIEGVYEYETYYQIHIRSNDKKVIDEIFTLYRNRPNNMIGNTYDYYILRNEYNPMNEIRLTKEMIQFKDMFLHSIETILKMNN